MAQRWHIPRPGPVGVLPVQTVDGRRLRVRRRQGGASGEHVLVAADGSEWIAVGASSSVAPLAEVEAWRRRGETLAEAARRYPTGAA